MHYSAVDDRFPGTGDAKTFDPLREPFALRLQAKKTPTAFVNQSQDGRRHRLIVCTGVNTGRQVLFVKE